MAPSLTPPVKPAAESAQRAARRGRLLAFLGLVCAAAPVSAAQDVTELSLEQILDASVYSASKFQQKASEAPSSVTVVSAEEIRQFGWRTLAEVLRSVRGFYTHSDRVLDYVGVRGFAGAGDYNTRLLVLLDGYRLNDSLYDSGSIGSELPIDLDLVDHIEIVRGPGSALYGGNALFGVVNIITRSVSASAPGLVALRAGSQGTRSATATAAKQFESGASLLLSASNGWSKGGSPRFPEYDAPETNSGRARGTDYARLRQFFGKFTVGQLELTAAVSDREKGDPSALTGTIFNDRRNAESDYVSLIGLQYRTDLSATQQLSLRLSQSTYDYGGIYVYRNAEGLRDIVDDDSGRGSRWNAEARLLSALSPTHTLVTGFEYQSNYRVDQVSYVNSPGPALLDLHGATRRYGVFVQDQFDLSPTLSLSTGLRYDSTSNRKAVWSPRLGLIYKPAPATVWKAVVGTAFRSPNEYELRYAYPDSQIANPNLRDEKVRSAELTLEHYLRPQTRILASLYAYRVNDLVTQVAEATTGLLQYQNAGRVRAHGLEIEAEQKWESGARLRASLATQSARDESGAVLKNSPRHMAKLNLSVPLFAGATRLGVEGQWRAPRRTDTGDRTSSVGLVNLTLWRPEGKDGFDISASVFNLLDKRYTDPSAYDPGVPARDRIPQEGRSFRFGISYQF
jgi:outer membrane receptor protein involved in Fe transport